MPRTHGRRRGTALAAAGLLWVACGADRAAQRDADLAATAQSLGLTFALEPDSAHQPLDRGPEALPSGGAARNVMAGTFDGAAVRVFDWHYTAQHLRSDLERTRSRRQPFTRDTRGLGGRTDERPAATMLYVFPGIVADRPWFHYEAISEPEPGWPTLGRLYTNVVAADSARLFTPDAVQYLVDHSGWSAETRGEDLIVFRKGQRCAAAELRACLADAVGLARALTANTLDRFSDSGGPSGRWGLRRRFGAVMIPAIYEAIGQLEGVRVFVVLRTDSLLERFAWLDSTGAIVERFRPDTTAVAPTPSDTCTTLESYWSELGLPRDTVHGTALGSLDELSQQLQRFDVYRLSHGALGVEHAGDKTILLVPGLPRAAAEAFVERLNRLHNRPDMEECERVSHDLLAFSWGFGIRASRGRCD